MTNSSERKHAFWPSPDGDANAPAQDNLSCGLHNSQNFLENLSMEILFFEFLLKGRMHTATSLLTDSQQ